MKRVIIGVLAVVTFTVVAFAQTSGVAAFDAASVKPNTSGAPGSSGRTGRGSVTFTNFTLRSLISNAFDTRNNRIVNGPPWIDTERFDVTAKAADGTDDKELMPMLRTLLADRFKLVVRHEAREEPIYALVTAREDKRLGPNLRPSTSCAKAAAPGGTS